MSLFGLCTAPIWRRAERHLRSSYCTTAIELPSADVALRMCTAAVKLQAERRHRSPYVHGSYGMQAKPRCRSVVMHCTGLAACGAYSRGADPRTATPVSMSVPYDLILTSVREQT